MWDWGNGWGWLWGFLMMIVFWGGFAVLVVWLIRDRDRSSARDRSEQPDARAILEERFARGEISEEEFHDRMRVLEHRRSGRSPA